MELLFKNECTESLNLNFYRKLNCLIYIELENTKLFYDICIYIKLKQFV